MKNEPEIVEELRRQEKLGNLRINSQHLTNVEKVSENIDKIIIQNSKLQDYSCDKENSSYNTNINDLKKIINNSKILFELSPEGIALIDVNGILLDVNKRLCDWLGYKDNDLHGRCFFDFPFLIGRNKLPVKNLFSQIKNTEFISKEITYYNNCNEKLFGMLHISPIENIEHEITGYILMISDITDIISAEDEINELRQFHENIIENAEVWLSVADLQGNILLWNKAAEKITGYNRNEVFGNNNIWELIKPDDKNYSVKRNLKNNTLNNDETIITENYESIIKRKDGNIRTIAWNSRVLLDNSNNPIGNIALGQDITDQREYEEEIKKQNIELNNLNKNLEEKVQDKTKKIKDLLIQKDDFINQLSHDLKTPLTPMMVLIPLLRKKTESNKDKELFDVVIRNIFYMKDLVNKTLDLAKLNSDKIAFNLESINLNNEISTIIENNKVVLEKNNIKIINKVSELIKVEADQLRLDEIFNNLITNSIKYSPKSGGKIVIDAIKKNNLVTVSIKDDGIGMDSKQQKHIFDEFYKADDSRHELDSSGLGLTITKKLVKKHGGKIWVKSEGKGKGSTFYFTLKSA